MNHIKSYTVHQTDLLRPYEDPDDHWDLVTQFALNTLGFQELSAIMLDSPIGKNCDKKPDCVSVEMLNGFYKTNVPYGIGNTYYSEHKSEYSGRKSAVDLLLHTLETSPEKVSVHICGSCEDVALAARISPKLFKEKCAGIYLNAGASLDRSEIEYNVALAPDTYAEIFTIPCNIYWMPCFEYCDDFWNGESGRYSTFYRFEQSCILPFLPLEIQQYFAFMFEKEAAERKTDFLNATAGKKIAEKTKEYGKGKRNMWCTAGFLHSAGLGVLKDGTVFESQNASENEVFEFVPISVNSIKNGIVSWQETKEESNLFIFKRKNDSLYQTAMTNALKNILCKN